MIKFMVCGSKLFSLESHIQQNGFGFTLFHIR